MKSSIPRRLFFTILSILILSLVGLAILFLTRSDLLRVRNLNPSPDVYFYDDFSRFYSGWDIQKGEEGATGYEARRYLIKVEEPNLDLWGTAGLDLNNVSIEVDTSRVAGPESGTLGIICRYRDEDNFYFGIITTDGFYGIGEYAEGGMRLHSGNGLKPTSSVKGGSLVNHLRLDCVGSTLTFYVNGYLLASVEGVALSSGDVGMIAGTLEEPGVETAFDDFVVFSP